MKRIAHVAVLLLICGAANADRVDDARRQLDRGQFAPALETLDKHLADEPSDAEARFLRALTLVMLERNDDAVQAFADLTRDYPDLPEPYNNLAVLYARQGQYEKARDALEAALATHPSYATAHENLGDIYTALAGAAYNRALVLDKNNQALRVKLNMVNQLSESQGGSAGTGSLTAAAPSPTPKPVTSSPRPVTPATTPAPTTAPDLAVAEQVKEAVYAWASAWSRQNLDGYLAAYGPSFRPPGGITRSAWERQRRSRISAPASISVKILNPTVALQGADRARISFIQIYESDTYADQVRKALEMELKDGRWLIVSEAVTN